MPSNYVPCRTGEDDDVHLFMAAGSQESICGKSVSGTSRGDDGRTPCRDCARRLLVLAFRAASQEGGISSIEVTLRQ